MMEQEIQHLLEKYRKGTITDLELDELYSRISDSRGLSAFDWTQELLDEELENAKPIILTKTKKTFTLKSLYYYAASAILVFGFYFAYQNKAFMFGSDGDDAELVVASDKVAGTFKAFIKGEHDDAYKALDSSDVQVANILQERNNADGIAWQSLHTPNGTEFKVELEDGTMLWLGPGSTVQFPTRFENSKREVFIEGEVLLEVAHQANKPFFVHTDHQDIEVKGTLFNVRSSSESTTTTLINGVVWAAPKSSANKIVLKPGQSIVATDGKQELTDVSIDEILAWRDGFFYFENTPLEELLKKIASWYNVKIDRSDVDTSVKLSGRISKKKTLMEVARVFTLSTGIQFRLVNNTLVLKKK